MKNVQDFYPLSPLQQGMLFHTLEEPSAGVYSEQMAVELAGELDPEAFLQAWQRLVERHAALRTGFVWEGVKEPVQVVRQRVPAAVERLDWRRLSAAEVEERFTALAAERVARGFDLTRPPLAHLVLIQVGEGRHRFLLTSHHIILDAWSTALLLEDLFALYQAFLQGREPDRPRPRPYREYIAWLRKRDAGADESFWRRELAGLRQPTEVGDPWPSRPEEGSGDLLTPLSVPATEALTDCARRQGLTPANLAQGAWALLLGHHSGREEVLFGVTLSGRPPELPGVEGMVGLFINTAPLRTSLPPAAAVGDWLRALQERQARLLRHAYAPLTEVQGWSEVPRGRPLFSTLTVFENANTVAGTRLPGGLTARPVRVAERTKLPLVAIALPGKALTLRLTYDRRRFDPVTARRLLGHWRRLLEALPESLGRPLGQISPLSLAEEHELRFAWNDSAAPYPREETVAGLLAAQAGRTPEAVAVVEEEESWSYGTLLDRCRELAVHLRHLGVGPEVAVGVCLERSWELIVALAAVLRAGGAYVPLDPAYPAERLALMVEEVAAPVVITRSRHLTRLAPPEASRQVLPPPQGSPGASARSSPSESALEASTLVQRSGVENRPGLQGPSPGAGDSTSSAENVSREARWLAEESSTRARYGGRPGAAGSEPPAPGTPPFPEGRWLRESPRGNEVPPPRVSPGASARSSPPESASGGGLRPSGPESRVSGPAGPSGSAVGSDPAAEEPGTPEPPGGGPRFAHFDALPEAPLSIPAGGPSGAPGGGRRSAHLDAPPEAPLSVRAGGPPDAPGGGPRFLLLDRLPEVPAPTAMEGEVPALGGDALAYVLFTSGSTGRPKGVAVPQRGIVRLLFGSRFARLGPEQTLLALAPASFDASTLEIWGALLHGGRLVLAPAEVPSPSELGALLVRHRVTTLWLTAGLFQRVVEEDPAHLACLDQLLAGGDVLPSAAVERLLAAAPGLTLVNGYGPTENTTFTCCHRVSAPETGQGTGSGPVPIGRPIAHTTVHLLERRGRPVPPGVPGELVTGGDGLARGYFSRPAATAERFVPDGVGAASGARLYRTGDQARHLPDGRLEFLGRIDQQVKVRGFRVEPGEVEAALGRHPAVAQAVVAAWGEGAGDRRLVAWWVPRGGEDEPGAEALRTFLAGHLPEPMIPAVFVPLPALPLSPTGKVDRRALPSPFAGGVTQAGEEAAGQAPRTPLEEEVAAIWREVLNLTELGVHDDFFELGGHSLLAMQVTSQVRARLGVELSIRVLLEGGTVARVAAAVEAARAGEEGVEVAAPAPEAAARVEETATRQRRLPLSFGQERLWFLQRLDPASGLYNIPAAMLLSGAHSLRALAASVRRIGRRHEVLRTTFVEAAGRPVQVVSDRTGIDLAVVDLSHLPSQVRRETLERLAFADVWRPFDLERGPLVRLRVLPMGDDEQGLLVTMHHIVTDGWSMGIFARELVELYHGILAGEEVELPPLPLQYGDYALRQRRELTRERVEAELGYWRRRLEGLPPLLELPTDHPRPPVWSGRGTSLHGLLPGPVLAELGEVARRSRTTLFVALLALYQALLARWSGCPDVAVGSPVAGRDRGPVQGLIGFFVNTLVLRSDLAGDPTFGDLLARVREGVLEAFTHQELPFEKLVAELAPARDPAVTPLVQVLFSLQHASQERLDLGDLELTYLKLPSASTKFDLSLMAQETGEGLWLDLEYATDLFDATTARRLLRHFVALVESAAAAPERRLSELASIPSAERHQLLVEWTDTARPHLPPATVPSLFAGWVQRAPERTAAVAGGEHLSYRGLARRARGLAALLQSRGLGPEGVAAVLLDRGLPLVTALLAVVEAGGAYLPLEVDQPAERLAFLLAETGAPVVITGGRPDPGLAAVAGEERHVLSFDESAFDESGGGEAAGGARPAALPLEPDHLAYVTYTSGSTGRPKGVAVPHRGVVRLVREAGFARLGPGEVFLQLAPVAFDASTLEIWGPLLNGSRLVVPPPGPPSLAELGRLLADHRVTSLWLTAGLFQQVVDRQPEILAPLTQLLTGGDVVPAAQARGLAAVRPDLALVDGYGPTESTTFTCCGPILPGEEGAVPVGRPIAATRVHLLDERARPVPLGAVGEVAIGGEGLARGYLARPAATAERFIPDPLAEAPGERLYRSGDRGRWRPDGRLDFLGRLDRQVKLRGLRIEPGEIEAALGQHPAVRRTVVVTGDLGLVAYAVPEAGSTVTGEELRRHLARSLPAYMVPAAFVLLDELPLTSRGKVDRAALPAPPAPGPGPALDRPLPARDPVEELVVGVFSQVLGRPAAADDDFFALGGHSLLAIQAVSRLQQVLGVEIPLRELFTAPTASAVAARVAALRSEARTGAPPSPIRRRHRPVEGGEAVAEPASLGQRRLWFLSQLDPKSAAYNMPLSLRLRGRLVPAALAASFGELVRRHESLRTTFVRRGGEPWQVIRPPAPVPLPVVDLSGLAAGDRGRLAGELAAREAERPFDLEGGPLLRVALVRLGREEHDGLLTVHHIVSDGWSMGVLVRELSALYQAYLEGRTSPLPELPVQYADYARWQRETQARELERQRAYWRRRLGGGLPPLDLPADRPRPPLQSFHGGRWSQRLEPELTTAVKELARERGATLFMTLLAAFKVLVSRLVGQEDVRVGTPIAGRGRPEVEELIGFFVNTLVLRTDLAGEPSFHQLLERVKTGALEAYEHQDVPFERLVEELAPERDLSRSPLFQVFFNMVNLPRLEARFPELTLEATTPLELPAKFDLTLYVHDLGEGLQVDWVYNRDLFDPSRVEAMGAQYRRLLEQAVERPEAAAGSYRLAVAEGAEALPDPGAELVPRWAPPVHAAFAAQAERSPEAVAVVEGQEAWSYRHLRRAAADLARRLGAGGAGRGDLVAVHALRSARLAEAVLGTLEAGAAFLLLDPSHPPARLAELLEIARPQGWLELPGLPRPEAVTVALDRLGVPCRLTLGALGSDSASRGVPLLVGAEEGPAVVAANSGRAGAAPMSRVGAEGNPPLAADNSGRAGVVSSNREGGDGAGGGGAGAQERSEASDEAPDGERRGEGPRLSERAQRASSRAARSEAQRAPVGSDPATAEAPPAPEPSGGPARAPDPHPLLPEDLAYVAFTSGTEGGRPKAVAGPHGPLARFLAWHVARHGFGPGDRVSLLSGLGHDPLLRDLLTPLVCGATLEVPDPVEWWTPGWLASWMGERRITVCHLTPSMTRLLAVRGRRGEGGPGSLAGLSWAFFGGEPLTGKDVERLRSLAPGVRMVNVYGATETPQGMGWHPLEEGRREADPLPVGRGIEGVQLLVLDRRSDTAGVGEVGEIAIRTPYLSRGYLGDPRATALRFTPADAGGRLYRTGDLGRYRPDGSVEYLGRRDRQVKVRGFRVEPAEVERVLAGLPEVAAAVVAARPAGAGEGAEATELRLLAWVVPEEGRELAAPAVLEALRRRLPEYLVPAALVPVAALPLTSRGKVDHRALPDPEATAARRDGPVEAPRSALERTIATIFRQVLGVEEVGRHDRFFDLGGHSLHLVEVRARLEAELDRELPLPELFNHPTAASLAAYLGEAAGGGQALEEVEERAGELAAGRARRLERRGRRASLLEGLDDG